MKTISVPVNKEAMKRLDMDECVDGDLIEISLTVDQFRLIQDMGFFEDLNRNLNTLIDEFEDEMISNPDLLGTVIKISKNYAEKNDDIFFKKFADLAEEAKSRNTGLFLFL